MHRGQSFKLRKGGGRDGAALITSSDARAAAGKGVDCPQPYGLVEWRKMRAWHV